MSSIKKDFFDKIITVYPTLSPKKKRVADFILRDYKKVFLMTAKEIAEECEVSEPTIIRFTVDLGFTGYTDFMQQVKALLHMELTSEERLIKASRQNKEKSTLKRYYQNALHNIENAMNAFSEADFKQIAKELHKADQVFVAGYRASGTLAYYLGYLLKKVRRNVFTDINLSWDLMDSITHCGKNSLLFAIAYPRYPARTIAVMNHAKRYGLKIISLTDHHKSPVVSLSDHHIILDVEGVSFVDPFSHVIPFLGALVHEVSFFDNKKAMERISAFDKSVELSDEFFSEENCDERLKYKSDGSRLNSLWPEKQ
jgi:DNA-binding MurR/RpiR family transcriptional regulator